jgi:hypothetical protein
LNCWLLPFLWLATTAAQAGVPWAWLNAEAAVIGKKQNQLRVELEQLVSAPSAQPHEHAGFHSGFAPQPDSIRWVQVDLGAEHRLDAVVVVPAMFGSAEAYGFPRRCLE